MRHTREYWIVKANIKYATNFMYIAVLALSIIASICIDVGFILLITLFSILLYKNNN